MRFGGDGRNNEQEERRRDGGQPAGDPLPPAPGCPLPELPPDPQAATLAKLAPALVRLLGWFLGCGYALAGVLLAVCHDAENHDTPGRVCHDLGGKLERTHSEALQTLVTLLAGAGLRGGQ